MKMLDVLFATGYLDRRASHLPKGDMIPDTSSMPRSTPVLVQLGKQIIEVFAESFLRKFFFHFAPPLIQKKLKDDIFENSMIVK